MMDQRWRPTVNEREFIEHALQSDLRVDGRRPFDFRKLKIAFGRYLGSIPSPSIPPSPTVLGFSCRDGDLLCPRFDVRFGVC
jgi:hypothetical protein